MEELILYEQQLKNGLKERVQESFLNCWKYGKKRENKLNELCKTNLWEGG